LEYRNRSLKRWYPARYIASGSNKGKRNNPQDCEDEKKGKHEKEVVSRLNEKKL